MADLERYSSFEEMENAPRKPGENKRVSKRKKLTTIKEFALLLRKSVSPAPTQKPSSKK